MKWKRSQDQHTETHDGAWKIRPRYWGRVRAVEYALTHDGVHVGAFDSQRAAKAQAANQLSAPSAPAQGKNGK